MSESVGGFIFAEVTYAPSTLVPKHAHELSCLALTLSGTSTESFGRLRLDRQAQTVLYRPASVPHSDRIGPNGSRCFLVEFEELQTRGHSDAPVSLARPFVSQSSELSRLALRAHRAWASAGYTQSAIVQAAYDMLAMLDVVIPRLDAPSRPPAWLKRLRDALHDRSNQPVRLESLAAIAGVHPWHVARAFRKHYGTTVGDYLRARRIDRAKHLLEETTVPIADIALEAGFASQSHLCEVFKRLTGQTPGAFRRQRGHPPSEGR